MGSGCENLIADKHPSSARQLPILAALYARSSTLFDAYDTPSRPKSKSPIYIFRLICIDSPVSLFQTIEKQANLPGKSSKSSAVFVGFPKTAGVK